jgi:hypothetical protein
MRRAGLVAVIVGSLIAAACGGGSDPSSRPRAVVTTSTTTATPFDETDLRFSQDFWHSGFHVELTRAEVWTSQTLMTNRISYWLTLWGDFENLGDEAAEFDPAMAIEESGVAYVNRSADPPPAVLPESTALGKITFLIAEDLDLESAELVVGAPSESQARVPLGSAGTATRLEPADLAVGSRTATDLVDIELTEGSLRYDVPVWHQQLEAGEAALTLHFAVTSRAPGEGRIGPDDLALVLPDGSILTPAVADVGAVAGDPAGITTPGLSVTFVLDETVTGDFALRLALDEPWVGEDASAEALVDFSL